MSEQTTNPYPDLRIERAWDYVKAIRNPAKHDYAADHLRYLLGMIKWRPEAFDISYMAAQAVRMNLDNILGEVTS